MHLITCVNARQIIIDSMTFNIKLINLLSSTEFKSVMSSLPILTIRVIDTLSSGEAKLFYHSLWNLCSSAIDFVNQEDMIVLFAEITARVANALEMENLHYLPSRRKIQRRKRKVLIPTTTGVNDKNNGIGGGTKVMTMRRRRKRKGSDQNQQQHQLPSYRINVAALEARRRQERNHFMKQTYNQRVLLRHDDDNVDYQIRMDGHHHDHDCYGDEFDNGPVAFNQDRQVEDAILSSLSPDHSTYADDDAWLTRLGRHDKNNDNAAENHDKNVNTSALFEDNFDAPSLPSKVILKNNHDRNENTQFSIDSSIHLDDLDVQSNDNVDEDEDGYIDVVDTSYLRTGIEKSKLNNNSKNLYATDGNDRRLHSSIDDYHDMEDNEALAEDVDESKNYVDIEDLVLNSTDHADHNREDVNEDIHHSDTGAGVKEKKPMKKIDLTLSQEDIPERNMSHDNLESIGARKRNVDIRGEKSTVAQFCRALDDIATTIRNQNISDVLKENVGNSTNKKRAKWYPNAAAAAGAGNECGQDILQNWGMQPARFRANVGVGNTHSFEDNDEIDKKQSAWKAILKLISSQLTQKQKIVMVLIVSAYLFICSVWFVFGCYGVYNWIFDRSSHNVAASTTSTGISENEIVIRIIQEDRSKQALIDTVVKAVGDTAKAGESAFVKNIIASIQDEEL